MKEPALHHQSSKSELNSSCLLLSSANLSCPSLIILQVFAQGILPTPMVPLSLILPSRFGSGLPWWHSG